MPLSTQPANLAAAPRRSAVHVIGRGLQRLMLVVHTLRFLRARQWFYLIVRRVLPDFYRTCTTPSLQVAAARAFRVDAFSAVPQHCVDGGRFVFLNDPACFDIDTPDWISASKPKLWRYNLHYFEFLADSTLSDAARAKLIDSWIAANPVGSGDGWEPYPVSLRIIAWVRYFDYLHCCGRGIPPVWKQSLYSQCDWLFHHIEFHIDANHLFKNIAALFLGSHFLRDLDDNNIRHWHKKSRVLLKAALREQFNDDGGHYERSPMYHLLCLHYCVDIYNALLLDALLPQREQNELITQLATIIRRGFTFAGIMQHRNGVLAFFNDSANGIAPDLLSLINYARMIDSALVVCTRPPNGSLWLVKSGFFCWHDTRRHLLVNAQSANPSYQPGHAHADCLSYELSVDGKPMVVNAGNTRYDVSDDRRYARSTAAHNTLEIDGQNQSELWDAFRMARRASVKMHALRKIDHGAAFSATHDGYSRLQPALLPGIKLSRKRELLHSREFIVKPDCILIVDRLEGRGSHSIRLFTHIHPDFCVVRGPDDTVFLIEDRNKAVVATVRFVPQSKGLSLKVERTPYFDQFGQRQLRDSIIAEGTLELPQTLCHGIETQDIEIQEIEIQDTEIADSIREP